MSSLAAIIDKLKPILHYFTVTASEKKLHKIVRRTLLTKQEILDLKSRARLQQTKISQQRETAHQYMGDVISAYRGSGLEYEESRHYQAGDDPRFMNWRLAAKTGELYMKVFREERQPGVFVLIDRRESMRFGTKIRLKVTQAARIATIIAFSTQQRTTGLSGVILNSVPHWLNEAHSEREVFAWLRNVCSPCPPLSLLPSQELSSDDKNSETTMAQALRLLQSTLTPGSTLYLISDFIDIDQQHQSSLMQLATEHNVHAIHIFDPAELNLPKAGQQHLNSSSVGDSVNSAMSIDTESVLVRKDYRIAVLQHFNQVEQRIRSLGISYVKISTLNDNIENRIPL